ncbi:MAG: hypothetical protein WCX30_03880 [Candidatus Paceibacterota bacterium]|jgi:hypothetical protein
MNQIQEQKLKPSLVETFIKKFLGVLLLLSAIPPLINPMTIPLVIFCIVFAIYILSNKKINLTFNLIGLIIGGLLYFLTIFNSFKILMLYTAQNNNDFIGFLLFGPAVILLLISSLFMLSQSLLCENSSYKESKNRGWISLGTLFIIILLVLGGPMIKQPQIKIGLLDGMNPNGSKQNVLVSFDEKNKEWLYIVKRKNETDKPFVLTSLFKNKEQIIEESENITIRNGILSYGRLTIEPFNEAIITIRSDKPIYTMTFTLENNLADSYIFIK